MHPASIALGERPVGDLADQTLDEDVLSLLRRPRVDFQRQHLAADQPEEPFRDLVGRRAADCREAVQAERLADHRRCLEQRPISAIQAIEAGGDQRVQRCGHRQLGQVSGRAEHPVMERHEAVAEEHADGLDRV